MVGWDVDPLVASWRGLPVLAEHVSADACVVGLGASGLAAVAEFERRGLTVVGVDARRVAAGAAGRNGGFLLGGPALFLHRAIEAWGADAAVDLYRATLDELTALADVPSVRRVGSIRLAASVEEEADCALHEAALRTYGFSVERYDGELGRGLFLPDDAAMNPAVRALTLAAGSVSQLYENSPVRSVSAGRVVTERGSVSAGVVVVAVDGRLEVVLPQLRGRVRTARLQMLATAPRPAGLLSCPVYARWGYDYAQQAPDGRVFVGGGRDLFEAEEWTTDAEPTESVQAYVEKVAERFTGGRAPVTDRWAASVGFTPDGRPLCTLVDDGVVAIGGYNGTGNLVGPVAARAAVALALDGTPSPAYLAS